MKDLLKKTPQELNKELVKKPNEWKKEVVKHKGLIFLSVLFLVTALTLNSFAGSYADHIGVDSVPDLILDHIPTVNLYFLYIYVFSAVVLIFLIYPLFFKTEELHIVISQLSLLVMLRSFFITLTSLKIPADALVFTAPGWFNLFDFQNALFFSGHTATPFLGYLLFKDRPIGKFFLFATVVMALTVLFMHVHYSIDVFAALFIAYGSYTLGKWLFMRVNHY